MVAFIRGRVAELKEELLAEAHHFNAGEGHSRGPEGFEPQHRSCLSLDGSVILLDDVVEVFDLAYLNTSLGLGVVTFYSLRVSSPAERERSVEDAKSPRRC